MMSTHNTHFCLRSLTCIACLSYVTCHNKLLCKLDQDNEKCVECKELTMCTSRKRTKLSLVRGEEMGSHPGSRGGSVERKWGPVMVWWARNGRNIHGARMIERAPRCASMRGLLTGETRQEDILPLSTGVRAWAD